MGRRRYVVAAVCLDCWRMRNTGEPKRERGLPPERCVHCGMTTRAGIRVEVDLHAVAFPEAARKGR